MTPDYARELLEKATPGEWGLGFDRKNLAVKINNRIGPPTIDDVYLAAEAPELAGHYVTLIEALEEMVAVIDAEDAHNRPETRISPREARQWMRKFCTGLLEKVVDE